jgi:hypothetical protein
MRPPLQSPAARRHQGFSPKAHHCPGLSRSDGLQLSGRANTATREHRDGAQKSGTTRQSTLRGRFGVAGREVPTFPFEQTTRPERERRQPRYGRHPDLGPCPYQRSQTSDDTGDSTSEIIRTGAESHGGAATSPGASLVWRRRGARSEDSAGQGGEVRVRLGADLPALCG